MVFFLVLQSKKAYFLFPQVLYPRVLLCNLSNFIYDTNMLIPRLQNAYFKERLQFISALSLFSCLSVRYKDRPMIWDEEVKLAFKQWIQKYCPVNAWVNFCISMACAALLMSSQCWFIRCWVESSSGIAKITKTLNYRFMFRLLTEFIIVSSVLSDYILCMICSGPKQNGDLFGGGCWSTETVLWKRSFHLTCFFVKLTPFPSSSLWQFGICEPIMHGQQRGRLPL